MKPRRCPDCWEEHHHTVYFCEHGNCPCCESRCPDCHRRAQKEAEADHIWAMNQRANDRMAEMCGLTEDDLERGRR